MKKDSISIRLATVADVDTLTELHYASFAPNEHVPVMLGKQYVRATYVWQITGKRSYVLVAEELGKIVGLIAVCDGPFTRPMFFACLPELIKGLLQSPGLIFQKKLWSRLFRRPDISKSSKSIADYPGFAQMTIGAVDAECRGMGVFPALVEATKGYSKNRRSRAIRAGIYKINQPSRRVFIKGGWIETPELETNSSREKRGGLLLQVLQTMHYAEKCPLVPRYFPTRYQGIEVVSWHNFPTRTQTTAKTKMPWA